MMKPSRLYVRYVLLFMLLSLISCGGRKSENRKVSDEKAEKTFPMVSVPSMITDSKDVIDFMVMHYWDNVDFTDSLSCRNDSVIMKAGFDNYLSFLYSCDKNLWKGSMDKFVEDISKNNVYSKFFRNMVEDVLYNPSSNRRDDVLYEGFLRSFIASKDLDEYVKERYVKQLSLVVKNQPGKRANNFSYVTNKGYRGNLYKLQTNYTILYFNNPDCVGCKVIGTNLRRNRLINGLLQDGKISLLAVFTDKDKTVWRKSESKYLKLWINSCNENNRIESVPLYDLKAMPTLYLLDKDKIVILKDCNVEDIEHYFINKNILPGK